MNQSVFRPEQILPPILRLGAELDTLRFVLAFSGGLDSSVLLDALCSLRATHRFALRAVHIDHGLHPRSALWARHCVRVAESLGVDCEVRRVKPTGDTEGQAREARYAALADILATDEVLLTAHTRDDQSETVLLQLMRGAGPAGLAAMPEQTAFGPGVLLRPMLELEHLSLAAYAGRRRLDFLEDPANRDLRFERSFLRLEIIPRLRERWPALDANLARAARHLAEADRLLTDLARLDLARIETGAALSVAGLRALDDIRARNALRAYIRRRGFPLPSSARIHAVMRDLLPAAPDATPLVSWSGAELRRYRDRLFLMRPLADPSPSRLTWDPHTTIELPGGLGQLALQRVRGGPRALRARACTVALEVRFRSGGERFRPEGDTHTRSLKKLMQEHGVLPWMRSRIPLIHCDGELAAVGDLWVSDGHAARADEEGYRVLWARKPELN